MRRSWPLATLVAAAIVATATAERGDIEVDFPKACPEIDSIDKTLHLAHEWDCTKFYKCDHGERVIFECPVVDDQGNRMHFDPILQVCNWPKDVGCISGEEPSITGGAESTESTSITNPISSSGPSTISPHPPTNTTTSSGTSEKPTHSPTETSTSRIPEFTETTANTSTPLNPTKSTTASTDDLDQNSTPTPSGNFVPHENDCTKFYEIVNNSKILRECPSGFHFSSINKICMPPSEARCELTTPIPTTTIISTPGLCGRIGDGWVVAHECVCSKYYLCSNGDLVLKECPERLHFSRTVSGCVDPELAGCESTTVTTVASVITTVELPTECPPDNSGQPVKLPHPTNCSLYYKCDNGKKILSQCPKDLHFNPVLQMCDWIESAKCLIDSSTVEGAVTATESGVSAASEVTTVGTLTSGIPTECPPDNSGSTVHLPHPYNCTLYYKCDNGEKVVQSCPLGLEFNATEQVCDWPETAGCVISTIGTLETTWGWTTPTPSISSTEDDSGLPTSPTQDTTRPPSSSTQDTARPPSSTTQDTTRRPSSATQDTTRPPSSSTGYTTRPPSSTTLDTTSRPSSTTQDTTRPPSSTTQDTPSSSSTSHSPCIEKSKMPHKTNCSLFYECEDGINVIKECTGGLHFNPVLNICDWWEFAGCTATTISSINSSTISLPASSEFTTDDYIGQDGSTTESEATRSSTVSVIPSSITPASSTTTEGSIITEPSGHPACIGDCPNKDPMSYTVLLPNEDCTKFCKCSNGRGYVYDCPAELHFSPTKLVCDYPIRAKCLGAGGWGESKIEVIHAFD